MCPAGFPSIYGERQEHTLVWEEGKESRTDKHHRMDFGKAMKPKRMFFPAWVSLGGNNSYSEALWQRGAGCSKVWREQRGNKVCGTYLNTLRAKEDPGPSVGNDGSQQEV